MQEYFAAQFIYLDSKTAQIKILERILNGKDIDKSFNLLDIYYDIDYKSYRDVVIYQVLIDFKKHVAILREKVRKINEEELIQFAEVTFPALGYVSLVLENSKKDYNIKVQEAMHSYEKLNYLDEFERVVSNEYFDNANNVYTIQYYNTRRLDTLIILSNKKNDIAKSFYYKFNYGMDVFNKSAKEKLFKKKSKSIIIDYQHPTTVSMYGVDNLCSLLSRSTAFSTTLDYSKAMDMLRLIEREKETQNADDYLLSGL